MTIPRLLLPELRTHLLDFSQPTDDGWIFTGVTGGPLGPTWLNTQWKEARVYVGLPDLHPYDFRHLAGTLAALTDATTKESWNDWATPRWTRPCAISTPPVNENVLWPTRSTCSSSPTCPNAADAMSRSSTA